MKKIIAGVLVGLIVAAPTAAQAAPVSTAVKTYANCTALNKDYKGGVARNAKVFNTKTVNGKKVRQPVKYRAKVNAAVYKANSKMDRDGDGIVCER